MLYFGYCGRISPYSMRSAAGWSTSYTEKPCRSRTRLAHFQIFNPRFLDSLARYRFQQLAASSLYSAQRESVIVLIPKRSLLICTKFKVGAWRLFVKSEQTRQLTRSMMFVSKTSCSVVLGLKFSLILYLIAQLCCSLRTSVSKIVKYGSTKEMW